MKKFEALEIQLLLTAMSEAYGYDFSGYSKASLTRRVRNFLGANKLKTPSELIPLVLKDRKFFGQLVKQFSITVTEMFRDPEMYNVMRKKVMPYLRTYPFFKVWHAGCATGQEVYSTAIVMKEMDLYRRASIYATDFNDDALHTARQGIYSLDNVKLYNQNYLKSGGEGSLTDHYHSEYDSIMLDKSLKKNILFANHNLVTDTVFSEETNLILCRNVLIYFDKTLQDRVLKLFDDSLVRNGFLILGSKESLQFSNIADKFKVVDNKWRIFQKKAF